MFRSGCVKLVSNIIDSVRTHSESMITRQLSNNTSQSMGDDSSQSLKDSSDDDAMDVMYDCNEIDECYLLY
jgi:phosphate uptake regulator